MIERMQGTDGIRGPICFSDASQSSDPMTAFLNEGVLTEEFFELYTFAYCKELIETHFASEDDTAVIGWDPRDFSGIFYDAAVRGIRKAGLTAVSVDILPTPAISLYQLQTRAACGFVLTASHNPANQNGIKIFLGYSNLKLFPEDDKRLTQRCLDINFDDVKNAPLIGEFKNEHIAAKNLFKEFMYDKENHWMVGDTLGGTTIIIDLANGAFSPLMGDLLKFDSGNFLITNSNPSNGINLYSGVADLEGFDSISASEIEIGCFSKYETLNLLLKEGRKQKAKLTNSSNLVLGFVFDGDGDRCFILSYDPFEDRVIVLNGDVLSFFQAGFLQRKNLLSKDPLFINTIESDIEASNAVQRKGFKTVQCAVGDKWMLWEACFCNWKVKQDYYEQQIDVPEFKNLLMQVKLKLNQMVHNSRFDALYATKTFMTLENWVRKNVGDEIVKNSHENACVHSNSYFSIGAEESGHVVTLGKISSGNTRSPVFIGNSLKCAFNTIAAVKELRELSNSPEFYKWMQAPFPNGFQKSLPVYYVNKKELEEGSLIRKKLIELLLENTNWPGVEIKIEQRDEEREMLILRVLEYGFFVSSVFVRNSGTEDKLVLYLRGKKEWKIRLEGLSELIYPYLQFSFKNKNNPMAQMEQKVLQVLNYGPRKKLNSIIDKLSKNQTEQLINEMSARQKLICKEGETWKITKMGQRLINFSERSEK